MSAFAGMTLALVGCANESDKLLPEPAFIRRTVTFAMPRVLPGNGRTASADPKSVLVTILDKDGGEVVTRKELTVYRVGTQFLSLPLALDVPSGTTTFKLREFMVVGSEGNITHITPKEGSLKAHLVSDPLDIDFSVETAGEVLLEPQVVVVEEESDPAVYGYAQFTFSVVDAIRARFIGFVIDGDSPSFSDMDIRIVGTQAGSGATWNYATTLHGIAELDLKKSISFRVTATKPGYVTWERTMTIADNANVEIILQRDIYPTVTAFMPPTGFEGQVIRVVGKNLGMSMQDLNVLFIGEYHLLPLRWISSNEIEAILQPYHGPGNAPIGPFPLHGFIDGRPIVSYQLFHIIPMPAVSSGG